MEVHGTGLPISLSALGVRSRRGVGGSASLQEASANGPVAEARTREYRHCALRINHAICPTVPWPTANKHIADRAGFRGHLPRDPTAGSSDDSAAAFCALREYSIPRCSGLRGAKASTRAQDPAAGVIATSRGTRYLAPPILVALIDHESKP
jgi:hypothetical protein